MCRRLSIDRRLDTASSSAAALRAALSYLGAPALVLAADGRILEVNDAAHALLTTSRDDLNESLRSALAGHTGPMAFEMTRLVDHGTPASWLAVLRMDRREARIATAVAAATAWWGLTRRQGEVLDWVVRGHDNITIAVELGISGRAVELHVTAMFDRAGVESRTALVAKVLLGISG